MVTSISMEEVCWVYSHAVNSLGYIFLTGEALVVFNLSLGLSFLAGSASIGKLGERIDFWVMPVGEDASSVIP